MYVFVGNVNIDKHFISGIFMHFEMNKVNESEMCNVELSIQRILT